MIKRSCYRCLFILVLLSIPLLLSAGRYRIDLKSNSHLALGGIGENRLIAVLDEDAGNDGESGLRGHECRGELDPTSLKCDDAMGVTECEGQCVPSVNRGFMPPVLPIKVKPGTIQPKATLGPGAITLIVIAAIAAAIDASTSKGGYDCISPSQSLTCDPPKGQYYKECILTGYRNDFCDTETNEMFLCGPLRQVSCANVLNSNDCSSASDICYTTPSLGNIVGTCPPIKQECKY